MPEYTASQRAALSFAALEQGDPGAWRQISTRLLSFTTASGDPLSQLYGTITAGFTRLHIRPGATAGLGFGACGPGDAEQLRMAWMLLLTPDPAETSRPTIRPKERHTA